MFLLFFGGEFVIHLYSGTPGSGKSLHVASTIRQWLRLKKRVISTCDIDTRLCFMPKIIEFVYELTRGKVFLYDKNDSRANLFTFIDIHNITPKMLYEYAAKYHKEGKEKQTLVIFDECVSIFSPTVLTTTAWNEWERFFQYHRHIGFEVILIPQSSKLISRKVIEYCEFDIRHRAIKNSGFFGWVVSFLSGGLFSAGTYWRGINKIQSKEWFRFHYYLGKMYNSYAMFNVILGEFRTDKLTNNSSSEEEKLELIGKLCTIIEERRLQLEKNNLLTNSSVTGVNACLQYES